MAYWLDPLNNRLPREFGPDAEVISTGLKTSLPAGVDRITAIDAQSTLLVLGTAEGAQKVREVVAALDKPQRRVTLQARLVTVQNDKLSGIWADLAARATPEAPAAAPVSARDEQILGEQFLRLQARVESVRNLTIRTGEAQNVDFSAPAPTGRKPGWSGDFSSAMPVLPPPRIDEMWVLGRRNSSVPPAATTPPAASFDRIRLQISPTLDGNLVTLHMLFPQPSAARPSTQLSAGLRKGETLALALPADATGNRAFLLLAARLVPTLQAAPAHSGQR